MVADLGWVDLLLLAVLALSVLIGLWRGLVFELMSLLGWVMAYVAAQPLAPQVARLMPADAAGSAEAPWRMVVAFALAFVGVLLAWAVLARLVRFVIHATPLTVPDRLLGAGFGLLRGLLLLLVLATLVALSPAARTQAWQASQGAQRLTALLHALKPWLPEAVASRLPR